MAQSSCNTVEAKTRLNELLHKVSAGEEIVIRRRGRAIAKLVAASEETLDDRSEIKRFMTGLRAFHLQVRRSHGSKSRTVELLRELRHEAR